MSGKGAIASDDVIAIARKFDIGGVTTHYKDTYQIRPLVTAGLSWHTDLLTLTAGVGFTSLGTVYVDLMGLYGEDQTWGAGAVRPDILTIAEAMRLRIFFVL